MSADRPTEAEVWAAELRADQLARAGAPAEDIDAADDETERLWQARRSR